MGAGQASLVGDISFKDARKRGGVVTLQFAPSVIVPLSWRSTFIAKQVVAAWRAATTARVSALLGKDVFILEAEKTQSLNKLKNTCDEAVKTALKGITGDNCETITSEVTAKKLAYDKKVTDISNTYEAAIAATKKAADSPGSEATKT